MAVLYPSQFVTFQTLLSPPFRLEHVLHRPRPADVPSLQDTGSAAEYNPRAHYSSELVTVVLRVVNGDPGTQGVSRMSS